MSRRTPSAGTKRTKKSGRKSGGNATSFRSGPDARRGSGPPKGAPNAGRPPDEFKALCAGLASRAATVKAVTQILANPDHPAFMNALKWATENGYEKLAQRQEHSGPGGAPIPLAVTVTRRIVRADGQ